LTNPKKTAQNTKNSMKKLFMTCIAIYFLVFSFVTQEAPVAEVVYSLQTVYMNPLDTALIALGAFNITDTMKKTIRKRGLGDQPKDKV
jgi:hypothetical protein